jgi:AraC-like DNA-binding protein
MQYGELFSVYQDMHALERRDFGARSCEVRSEARRKRVDDEPVIIVGRPEISGLIARIAGTAPVVTFASLEDLDRWRNAATRGVESTIRCDLASELEALGLNIEALPEKLRSAIESFTGEPQVPTLTRLESRWSSSRRSFYRVWNDCISEPPSTFLRHARVRHALRLISMGRTKKEAAFQAGFGSVNQMRRSCSRAR